MAGHALSRTRVRVSASLGTKHGPHLEAPGEHVPYSSELDEKNQDAPLGTEDAVPGSKFEGGSADSQDQHT